MCVCVCVCVYLFSREHLTLLPFQLFLFAEECVKLLLSLVTEAHKHTLRAFDPSLAIDSFLREKMEELLPSNAHELCSGRLHISVTKLMSLNFLDPANMRRNELISEFPTREALIEVMLIKLYVCF